MIIPFISSKTSAVNTAELKQTILTKSSSSIATAAVAPASLSLSFSFSLALSFVVIAANIA